VRVGVHEARKGEEAPAVEDFARVARRDLRCHEREAAVLDAEVDPLDRGLPGPHDAHVLHDQIERRHTIATASISMRSSGCASLLTSTIVEAGPLGPKNSSRRVRNWTPRAESFSRVRASGAKVSSGLTAACRNSLRYRPDGRGALPRQIGFPGDSR